MTNEEKIQLIGQKIYVLSNDIDKYRNELDSLRLQLEQLKMQMNQGIVTQHKISPVVEPEQKKIVAPVVNPVQQPVIPPVQQPVVPPQFQQQQNPQQQNFQQYNFQTQQQQKIVQPKKEFHLEEYIGGKVVSIVGISLLVIGLAVGVKFAIDNGYLGELGRIILGFLSGGILLTVAFFMRTKYKLFSSIILGGSISLMFFTSYVGFTPYNLYPREFAFGIMLLLTAFTVFAAHVYDYEVLAVIALVGAYSIPPLLRDDKGNVHIMFAYMAILNGGILALSFKKKWNWVTYFAYGLTWIIFGSWMISSYTEDRYFTTAFTFLNIFFLTFYAMFLAYKVVRKELFSAFDVVRIMSNSSVYFGIGYYLLNTESKQDYLGLFCIANALIHLIVAAICHRNKNADKKVMFLILTLVFTFITIAVPVQLEANWVIMVWFCEMALMWFMAQRFNIPLYKHFAFALSILGTFSLLFWWARFYYSGIPEYGGSVAQMFTNKYFMATLFSIGAIGIVKWLNSREKKDTEPDAKNAGFNSYSTFFSILMAVIVYFSIVNEIHLKFQNLYENSGTKSEVYDYMFDSGKNNVYRIYKVLWILIYSALYVAVLNVLNLSFWKNKSIRIAAWALNIITMFLCLAGGLLFVAALKREYYFAIENNKEATTLMHYARYMLIPFIILLLVNLFTFRKQDGMLWTKTVNLWIAHTTIIVLLSNELTFHITERNYGEYDKMLKISLRAGYTILWSVYAMGLFLFGFTRKRKMWRFIAMTLVGVTLLKLAIQAFSMTRGYQLITFSAIGIILILVGFLYQKFKHVLLEPDAEEKSGKKNPVE